MGVKLPIPLAPFQRLDVQGESITIDCNAKRIVIPTDNQLTLPSFNQWTENPNRCTLEETPCGGLKNSPVQDTFPGALSIEGDGCYLQNLTGTYTGKSIGAGKLSETADIIDTGATGLEIATADGAILRMGDGLPFLLRPPSAIVEEFVVRNISNESQTYTLTVICPDLISSLELYNITKEIKESVIFSKLNNIYSVSKTISPNYSESFQITVVYTDLSFTQAFSNDANQTIGLQNMSKSWIALIDAPKTDALLDLSGNDNVGTLSNVSLTYDNLGNPYGAVAIDGADSSINCGNSDIFNVTAAMTVVCWLKVLSYPTTYPRIMSKELANLGDSFGIYLRSANNNLGVVFNGVTDVATSAANSINSGWNRIVFTFNKPTALFYINGVRSGTAGTYNQNIQATVYDLLLGNNSAKTRYSDMLLKDVRFYNRTWSQAEVTADAAGQHVSTTGLIGQWQPYQPSNEIDIFNFTERPHQLSYKQEADGIISQITLYPSNGAINHSRITHPDHSKVSGTGVVPDCLNVEIEGSVAKFFKSFGMNTDFSSTATITTWVVPAISDEKILPLSTIPESSLGGEISLRMSPGEYGCASFVLQSDSDCIIEIEISKNNIILNNEIDIKTVKCWYQAGNTLSVRPTGKCLTPELLLHDDSLVLVSGDTLATSIYSPGYGTNYLKMGDGTYVNVSTNTPETTTNSVFDFELLGKTHLNSDYKKQIWISMHIPEAATPGTYTEIVYIKSGVTVLKTINLTIHILPISLSPPFIEYSLYYIPKLTSGLSTVSAKLKTVEQMTDDFKNMLTHNVTNPTIYPQNSLSDVESVLSARSSAGMSNSSLYYDVLHITDTVETIESHLTLLTTQGVSTVYIYGIDEADLSSSERRTMISNAHSAGVKVFCAQFKDKAELVADILDIAIVYDTLDKNLAALYHDPTGKYDGKPHKIYSYGNPMSIPEFPRAFRLNYGLLLWQNDYDGAMTFAYQFESASNLGSPWNDFDDVSDLSDPQRDSNFTYPTTTTPVDTVQWEGYREASNDIRYLTTLQTAITDAKNRGVITTDIEAWVSTLKTTDLSNADLDAIRSQMIDYILLLQSIENYRAVLMADGDAICFANGEQLFVRE